jgi:hypothetical protein
MLKAVELVKVGVVVEVVEVFSELFVDMLKNIAFIIIQLNVFLLGDFYLGCVMLAFLLDVILFIRLLNLLFTYY